MLNTQFCLCNPLTTTEQVTNLFLLLLPKKEKYRYRFRREVRGEWQHQFKLTESLWSFKYALFTTKVSRKATQERRRYDTGSLKLDSWWTEWSMFIFWLLLKHIWHLETFNPKVSKNKTKKITPGFKRNFKQQFVCVWASGKILLFLKLLVRTFEHVSNSIFCNSVVITKIIQYAYYMQSSMHHYATLVMF